MRKPDLSGNNNNNKLRKGLWSPEEDEKLMNYMLRNGQGCWSDVARNAGLQRCGKSCRLRWINYLRPDLKRGAFSLQEEDLILHLHSLLGNRWSQIAARLPGRTDNEIKNFWNSTIKKRLKINSSASSTPSPNTSDSFTSSGGPPPPKDNVMAAAPSRGLMSVQQQDQSSMISTTFMDSSPPSSSTISSMQLQAAMNYMINPLDLCGSYFMNAPLCMTEVGTMGGGENNLYENHGITTFGGGNNNYIGVVDEELFVPPLETIKIEEENVRTSTTDQDYYIFDRNNNTTYTNNNNKNNPYSSNMNNNFHNNIAAEVGNCWEEEDLIRDGEWDLEELMRDVSAFPLLDFHVQ